MKMTSFKSVITAAVVLFIIPISAHQKAAENERMHRNLRFQSNEKLDRENSRLWENEIFQVFSLGANPPARLFPLGRCLGDCDNDSDVSIVVHKSSFSSSSSSFPLLMFCCF